MALLRNRVLKCETLFMRKNILFVEKSCSSVVKMKIFVSLRNDV